MSVATAVLALTSCSTGGELQAAPSAAAPACSAALAKLPASVLGKGRTPLDVAGAASWGEPSIVLRCGLAALAPTTLQCLQVDAVDWVVDLDADPYVATAYGRDPAVEVRVPRSYGRENVGSALIDVGAVAAALPKNGRACLG